MKCTGMLHFNRKPCKEDTSRETGLRREDTITMDLKKQVMGLCTKLKCFRTETSAALL
jgi:hypothetical protein